MMLTMAAGHAPTQMPASGPSLYSGGRGDLKARQDARPPRNKLRKRPPILRLTQSEIVTINTRNPDADVASMGNPLSSLKPRPVRPPRPSQPDLPILPSPPIYQTVASKQARGFKEEEQEQKPLIPPKSPSRKSSLKHWPLPSVQDGVPPVPAIPPTWNPDPNPSMETRNKHAANYQAFPPPRYDRASQLAESYQSLLPEIDPDTNWTISWGEPAAEPPQYNQHQSSLKDEPDHHRPTDYTLCTTHAPDRSATMSPFSACPAPLRTSRRFPKTSSSPDPHQKAPVPPPCDAGPDPVHQNRQVTSALSTHGSTGLDLCAELLTHEIARAFKIPDAGSGGDGGTSKLQIMLLIEAYEATLETCRRELSSITAVEAGEEGEGGALRRWEAREEESRRRRRQWHIQEAIGILGHWLGVLYRICDGIYEEAWEGERRGDGMGMI